MILSVKMAHQKSRKHLAEKGDADASCTHGKAVSSIRS